MQEALMHEALIQKALIQKARGKRQGARGGINNQSLITRFSIT